MTLDKTIFGLRFGSSEDIAPTRGDLDAFLGSRKDERSPALHKDDLAAYQEMLERITGYEGRQLHAIGRQDFRELIFYGAVRHSCFFSASLKLAIEQYKYHVHAYSLIDLRKPTAFIQSAEAEMANLNPHRKEDAVRLARLQEMADERKENLSALRRNRDLISEELTGILRYITDNLEKIKILSDASIAVLAEIQASGTETNLLVADIKNHFKEQLKDELRNGPITKEHLEAVKQEVDALTKEIKTLVDEDLASLTRLYTAIYSHASKFADELAALLGIMTAVPEKNIEEEKNLFLRAEQLLVSLISDYQFPVKAAVIPPDAPYSDMLAEKRKEMIARVFELLHKDRRSRHERRTGSDRRILDDPELKVPNRRNGKDRRLEQRRD